MESLPTELVDCILDNLYFDTRTLRNCALVGSAWVRSSQRGIFRQIVLKPPSPNLLPPLMPKPYLPSYVQSLELREFENGSTDELDNATADVVRRLSNVNNLSFSTVYWITLSPLLRTELTKILRAPSLTQLSLELFYISTFWTDWQDLTGSVHELETGGPPPKSQLKRLRLGLEVDPFITWFQHDSCPFEARNYVGGNLRELEIQNPQFQDLNNYLEYALNIQILHLRHLPQRTAVFMIQALLKPLLNQDVGSRCSLQHLTLDLHLVYSALENRLLWGQWSAIDAMFERPEFALLEKVDFRLFNVNLDEYPAGITAIRELISGNLTFLERSGKLSVQIRQRRAQEPQSAHRSYLFRIVVPIQEKIYGIFTDLQVLIAKKTPYEPRYDPKMHPTSSFSCVLP
ncbi:hypothetical protein BT96DRAFT_1001460 [Gymnopus androsaceus JB14]|uniref:F-box domain-containing protein n=1 Tax=Gymnopus androsaceus JB14 TaxID=1447944 RepID=A0A6A4H0V6_9AGAR|nr:hypothetical protein BT96DRAFT_1001460 [Gymnopus androsaceus JB14]